MKTLIKAVVNDQYVSREITFNTLEEYHAAVEKAMQSMGCELVKEYDKIMRNSKSGA